MWMEASIDRQQGKMERPTTLLLPYDDLSEDESGAKIQARLKRQAAEAAMRCAQSLEDTHGLEQVAALSDKLLGYRSDRLLKASSNGIDPAAWLRGGISSSCGRGCDASPWESTRSLLGSVEYHEEDPLGQRPWRSYSAPQSSKELASASVVQGLLLARLKQRSCVPGDGGSSASVSSIVQEILAREISEQTAIALRARAHAAHRST